MTVSERARPPQGASGGGWLKTSSGTVTGAFRAPEWGLLAAVAVVWGSSYVFIAIGLETLRPGVVSLARLGLGALVLLCVPRARRPVDREDLPRIALLGIIWLGLPLILFPMAQQSIDSSVAGMISGAVPLTTAAFAAVLLRRLPSPRQLMGLSVGFVGVVAISWPNVQGSHATTLGIGLVLLAVTLYGLAGNLAVPLQQRYGALPVLLRAQVAALVVVAPFGLLQMPGSSWSWGPVLAMIPLGVLGTGLAYVAMTSLVGRVGGPRGSIALYFVPLVAIVLGVTVRGEPLTGLALTGSALVLVGAWLASRAESPATAVR